MKKQKVKQTKYRFSQLSDKAKERAAIEYQEGFNEGRPKRDHMDYRDAFSCCMDTEEEAWYDSKGTYLEEE